MNEIPAPKHLREDKAVSWGNAGGKARHVTQYYPIAHMDKNLPLFVPYMGKTRTYSDNYWKRTRSPVFSVELVTAGNVKFVQNERRYDINSSEVFLIHKDTSDYFTVGDAGFAHKRFMMIDGPLLQSILETTGLIHYDHIVPRSSKVIADIMKKSYRIFETRQENFCQHLSNMAYALLMELSYCVNKPQYPPALLNAIHYIQRNIQKAPSLRETAHAAGMSVPHLSRLFKKHFNISPGQFILQYKMDYACHRFEHSTLSVKQVAAELGYENPFSFSCQFKKMIGMAPKYYRIADHI